jgi:hypothetical protein
MDVTNEQLVGKQGDDIIIALPQARMCKPAALRHAAWIVAIADPEGDAFDEVLDAVRRT